MPKRTNEFQKVIFMLQRQLAGKADVNESKLLRNHDTGAEGEVDVVVETSVGGIPLVIGVECTARKRPANIEWIHQIYGKHLALPINATVLVSKSGYTKNALAQAEAFKIRALTIEEAEATSWSDLVEDVQQLVLGSFRFTIKSGTVHYYERAPTSAPDLALRPDLLVRQGLSDDPIRFTDLTKRILSDSRIVKETMTHFLSIPKERRPAQFSFIINWQPKETTVVTTPEEFQYRISQIDLEVAAHVITTSLCLSPGTFGDTDIAYGAAENICELSDNKNREVVVTLARGETHNLSGSIMIPKFEGKDDKVFDMKFAEDTSENDT